MGSALGAQIRKLLYFVLQHPIAAVRVLEHERALAVDECGPGVGVFCSRHRVLDLHGSRGLHWFDGLRETHEWAVFSP